MRLSRKIVADAAEEDGWPNREAWILFGILVSSIGAGIVLICMMLPLMCLVGPLRSQLDAILLFGFVALFIMVGGIMFAIDAHPGTTVDGKDHPFLRRLCRPIARVLSCYYCRRWRRRQEQ
jgi:hypothetical protein